MKSFFCGLVAIIAFMAACSVANTTNKTKFQYLDDYTVLEICDRLEFNELISLARTNARFRRIIADYYMMPIFRVHEKKVHLTNKIVGRRTPDTLFIGKFAEILLFLRNFGYLITNLKFSGNTFSKQNAAKINSFVGKYCSDALVELELNQNVDLIINSSKTFNKVTKLKLAHWELSNIEELDQLFPALEEFTLETCNPIPTSLIRTYSHIRHLHFLGIFTMNFTEDGVWAFLHKNPQLRALTLDRKPSYELLKYISGALSHLDSLAFRFSSKHFSTFPEVIQFDNVKKLSISTFEPTPQESNAMMTFNQLESLEIDTYKKTSVPIQLIREHNESLKSILFTDLLEADIVHILSQCGPFKALEEVRLHWRDLNELNPLFTEFETLKKITFLWLQSPSQPLTFEIMKSQLHGDWRFVEYFLAKYLTAYDLYHFIVSRERNENA